MNSWTDRPFPQIRFQKISSIRIGARSTSSVIRSPNNRLTVRLVRRLLAAAVSFFDKPFYRKPVLKRHQSITHMPATLRLILGDQLNAQHSWLQQVDAETTYVLFEMRQETDYVKHHIQKVVAFFAAMRAFAAELERQGHTVIYWRLDAKENTQSLPGNLSAVLQQGSFERFEYQLPDEYRLDQQLREFCTDLSLPAAAVDSEHFITKREAVTEFFGKKNYLMERFYRHWRKQTGYLMDGADPAGGQWNYDQENRNKLAKKALVPEPFPLYNDVTDLVALLEKEGVQTFGRLDPKALIWPINRAQSLTLLAYFLEECLVDFGRYQDAMHSDYWLLYHARLSFAMNSKILSPKEVIEAAIQQYYKDSNITLASIEGFVRQILGWREFIRGVYWAKMPAYEKENFFDHQRALPAFYWSGETKMNCLHHAINQSLDYAYAHHIQRLMITGNFALLTNAHPDAVDAWYLGIYIDAIQWVELPNTRGMSQYADGGLVATKPYISSANYINKMSNYCKGCYYNYKEKTGDKACPFNSLYWNFLMQHEKRLKGNHRMSMMYALLHKMSAEDQEALLLQAEHYLTHLDEL